MTPIRVLLFAIGLEFCMIVLIVIDLQQHHLWGIP